MPPLVGLIMGSASDWETLSHAAQTLDSLGVPYEVRIVSAHRTPDLLFEYAGSAEQRGLEVLLAGGQLGRMLALAGYPLGLRFRVLEPAPEAAAEHVAERIPGAFDDPEWLDRFAAGLDLVTYEFENVPVAAVRHLAEKVPVFP